MIRGLSSPALGDIHGEFAAWHSFASDKIKYIAVAKNHLQGEMDMIVDRELGKLVADKGNIEAKKAKARNSEQYRLMFSYMQNLIGLHTMLDLELDSYDKSISVLSREISRRENNAGF